MRRWESLRLLGKGGRKEGGSDEKRPGCWDSSKKSLARLRGPPTKVTFLQVPHPKEPPCERLGTAMGRWPGKNKMVGVEGRPGCGSAALSTAEAGQGQA